jgi:hypothetical protein
VGTKPVILGAGRRVEHLCGPNPEVASASAARGYSSGPPVCCRLCGVGSSGRKHARGSQDGTGAEHANAFFLESANLVQGAEHESGLHHPAASGELKCVATDDTINSHLTLAAAEIALGAVANRYDPSPKPTS